jgi:hypothetical protein
MKTRFRKVWCPQCNSMQFAGECGHVTNVVGPPPQFAALLSAAERIAPPCLSLPTPTCTCRDCTVKRARLGGSSINWDALADALFPEKRRCSCPLCQGGERKC